MKHIYHYVRKKIKLLLTLILLLHSPHILNKKIIDVDSNCYNRILCIEKKLADTQDEVRWTIGEIILTDTRLTTSGLYVLGKDIGSVEVESDDVVLDLNGYEVVSSGTAITVKENQNNIVIKNGSARGNCDAKGDIGVLVEEGAELVLIQDMNIYGFEKGIFFEGISTNSIRSCYVKNTILHCNTKGAVLEHTLKSTFENTEALNCVEAGFDLSNSKFNYFYQCKALETKNGEEEADAIGFSSTSGQANIFIECISNGSEKTDGNFGYNATGFLFQGKTNEAGETKSEIYNCIASKSTVLTGSGNAYGIHLDMVLRDTNEYDVLANPIATAANPLNTTLDANATDWSGESKFFAVGYDDGLVDSLIVYSYEDETPLLFASADADSTNILSVAFSPHGKHIAAGTAGGDLYIYPFDPTLPATSFFGTPIQPSPQVGGNVLSIDWHPSNKYLVLGITSGGGDEVDLYSFDETTGLTLIDSDAEPSTAVEVVSFSPDGNFIAVTYGTNLRIYRFNPLSAGSELVTEVTINDATSPSTYGGDLNSVDWCPIACNGTYFLVVGGTVDTNTNMEIFQYNGGTGLTALTSIATYEALNGQTIQSLQWSPNGKNILACGGASSDQIEIVQFDATAQTITNAAIGNFTSEDTARSCAWALGGRHIVVAGDQGSDIAVNVFEVGNAPTKCIIKNNEVINCSGGLASIGLEGSSGNNMIIKNIGYENDINFSEGVYNQYRGGLLGSPNLLENISIPPYED